MGMDLLICAYNTLMMITTNNSKKPIICSVIRIYKCNLCYFYDLITCDSSCAVSQVFPSLAVLVILVHAYATIPSIIFFACTIFYRFFTLKLTLIIIPFLFWITYSTMKFSSTYTWNLFYNSFWLIYSFDHIEYIEVYILNLLGIRWIILYKWIFNSITTSTAPLRTNDRWTVITFFRI